MSRRPLSLLVHEIVVPWTSLDWPVDWTSRFGRAAPLGLEIGFGNGDFLVRLAKERPHWNLVGIEISWGSLQRVLQRVEEAGLTNVRILQGDGAFLLERCFDDDSLDEVYVNFSDPWRKARHHGRRLVQPAFVDTLARRLRVGGSATIATDHADYAAWILEVLRGQSLLEPLDGREVVREIPGRIPTKYEAKAREAGIPIHFYLRSKTRETPGSAVRDEVAAMPNVLFEGTIPSVPSALGALPLVEETHHREVKVVVKVARLYREEGSGNLLLDTLVKEGPFTQEFGILVSPREEGGLLVKLSPLGAPRPTWGVKRAVALVARTLLAAEPGLVVLSTTVGDLAPPR